MSTNWKDSIAPSRLYLGVVTDGDTVPFSVHNSSETAFGSFTRSCSCTGDIAILEDGKVLSGQLVAKFNSATSELREYNGGYVQVIKQPGGNRYRDAVADTWLEGITEADLGPAVPAYSFNQSITVYGKTDEPYITIDASGEQRENPRLTKLNIPVQMFVLQKQA